MSKKDQIVEGDGLEVAAAEVTATETKETVKKFQTVEDKAILVAAVAAMRAIGVTPELDKILDLVPVWKGEDAELLSATKKTVADNFGGAELLKDFCDQSFDPSMVDFAAIAKAVPVLNNIQSFYGRRKATTGTRSKTKLILTIINGITYNVNAEFAESIKDMSKTDKKDALLAHPDTKVVVAEEL